MLSTNPHHIIAIGASAGGMEEINTFFDHTPLDGVAYVIVQHLSPDFKSRMTELLSKHSELKILEAKNETVVETNHVYLIPHNKFMTIRNSRLYLTEKADVKGPHLTVNHFFNSLAIDCGTKAIGVILSGLGKDGTEGIKSIKEAGGMVIARNPETTDFGSMPSHAIATGLVDYVLEPARMPDTIEEYVKNGAELVTGDTEDAKNITAIINLIKEQSLYDFSDYKQKTILRRVQRRLSSLNFTSLAKYLEYFKTSPEEVEILAKEFLISVTSFFRDKEAFDILQSEVLPTILKRLTPGEELKMWVAGCATGEEAYSLAILINEQLTGKLKDTIVKIFATDIDTIALAHAGKGIYNSNIGKDVSQKRLSTYFMKEGEHYKIKPEIRKMVIFAQHDMVKNPPYCNMSLISCRNLLIYMTPALQKKIFLMMLFGLKIEGYLFLGSSENPSPIIQNLEVVNGKWKIYKNLETKRVIRFDTFSLPEIKLSSSLHVRSEAPKDTTSNLAEVVNETLVNDLDYLLVCIDENNQVVKTYGNTTKYLLQKNFNSNFVELLPKPLVVAFNTLSIGATKSNKKTSVNGIQIKQGKDVIRLSLSVSPLPVKNGNQKLLMVSFKEDKVEDNSKESSFVFDEKIYTNQYTSNIEEELKELKDKLNSTYLQLDASNENMQSFNEELISANEEMQSTNEEMQSVNEELHTINSEYQSKNKELLEINDDLNNYFKSNINGQLFVNKELRLVKFSPGTVKQINLLATDIGRPLSNISTNIKFETILEDIKHVIKDGRIITKEIETNNGKWYQVMTMPYIQQAGNKINGAIISFNDITELKKTQLQLDKTNKDLLRINDDLDNFVYTASHDLKSPMSNIEGLILALTETLTEDKNKTSSISEMLAMIQLSIHRFKSTIADLTEISKIQRNMEEDIKKIQIEEVVKQVKILIKHHIQESNAVIHLAAECSNLYFSSRNFHSLLYNLLSNAIKYRALDRVPVIHIKCSKKEDQVLLEIEDNGMGIPQDQIGNIFKMFKRAHTHVEGSGIGLYLVNRIIENVGGKIEVTSKIGVGTTFKIYIPVLEKELAIA